MQTEIDRNVNNLNDTNEFLKPGNANAGNEKDLFLFDSENFISKNFENFAKEKNVNE